MKIFIKKYLNKISLLEYIAIFWLILFLGIFYFKNSRKTETIFIDLIFSTPEWMTSPMPPEYWQTSSIKVGDKAYNTIGKEVAVVTNVEKSFWGSNRQYIFVTIKAQSLFNKNTQTYQINNNQILIGSPLEIKVGKTIFSGSVFDFYSSPDEQFSNFAKASANITVKYRNLDPDHARSLKDFTLKNSHGEIVVKTTAFENDPADYIVTTTNGDVLLKKHPINRDVTISLELSDVLCADIDCFYNKVTPLKIGHQIWLSSETTILHPNGNTTFDLDPGMITKLSINRYDNI